MTARRAGFGQVSRSVRRACSAARRSSATLPATVSPCVTNGRSVDRIIQGRCRGVTASSFRSCGARSPKRARCRANAPATSAPCRPAAMSSQASGSGRSSTARRSAGAALTSSARAIADRTD